MFGIENWNENMNDDRWNITFFLYVKLLMIKVLDSYINFMMDQCSHIVLTFISYRYPFNVIQKDLLCVSAS